jgi:phage baseplate assembly protein W
MCWKAVVCGSRTNSGTEKTRQAIGCAIWLEVMTAMQPAAVQELARAIDNYENEQVE